MTAPYEGISYCSEVLAELTPAELTPAELAAPGCFSVLNPMDSQKTPKLTTQNAYHRFDTQNALNAPNETPKTFTQVPVHLSLQ